MKKKLLLLLFCVSTIAAFSQVRLARLVRDSMVLQRDAKINIWGWAAPGEKVSVKMNGKQAKTTTDADGKWLLQLPPMQAGGPYTLQVDASNHLTLKEVLIGDVWLCSGQSNMVHQMAIHNVRYEADIAAANYPQIRQFQVPNVANMQAPQHDLSSGNWAWANPKDILQFSAVAYFFARDLYQKYHVPIGIINASWGGTPIEAWMSEAGLQNFPSDLATIQRNRDPVFLKSMEPKGTSNGRPERDKGLSDMRPEAQGNFALQRAYKPWYDTAYRPKGWHPINIPGYWEDQGVKDLNGIVWYRREIDIPAAMATTPAKVFLGRIVDADWLYINGKRVGNTSYMYPQRRYAIPDGVLKPGKNLFVIRVQNNAGKGGFVPDKPYQLIAGKDTIDLKGTWEYKVGEVYPPQQGFAGGGGIAMQNQPTALYNSMIAPYINYTLKGIAWYQGESNAGQAEKYGKLLPALISNWRKAWQQPALPFAYVQLPGFMEVSYLPSESQWAALREAQMQTLSVPNTAMAVAIDLGEWNDIHPDRKKEVGQRLALAAEKIVYGEKGLISSGPLYQSATVDGNKIIISFSNAGSGLVSNDGESLSQFAIAGADKKWVWANARIEGNTVVVSSPETTAPLYVRYAWADNPDGANLYNREGLPASPFRTDK